MSMPSYYLLGNPVAKSQWARLHLEAAGGVFDSPAEFKAITATTIEPLRYTEAAGYAITTPLKRRVLAYMDAFSLGASISRCVNTVQVHHGVLIGHDTDGEAVARVLGADAEGKNVAVLGNGPVAQSIQTRLEAADCDVRLYTRAMLKEIEGGAIAADIVINATGSYTLGGPEQPIEFVHGHLDYGVFVELAYQEGDTPLLAQAKAAGARYYTGLDVLAKVVETQREIWGLAKPTEKREDAK